MRARPRSRRTRRQPSHDAIVAEARGRERLLEQVDARRQLVVLAVAAVVAVAGVWVTADSEWRSFVPTVISGLAAAVAVVAAIVMALRGDRRAYIVLAAAVAAGAAQGHFIGPWWSHQ